MFSFYFPPLMISTIITIAIAKAYASLIYVISVPCIYTNYSSYLKKLLNYPSLPLDSEFLKSKNTVYHLYSPESNFF